VSVIRYEWEPDPIVFADAILTVDTALRNPAPALLMSKELAQEDIRERFLTETDPQGGKWQEWSERYAPIAEAFPNDGILRQTGELYDAATSDTAFIITQDTVFYQTDMPERGMWHQEGRWDRKTKGGNPSPLPDRPFLGLTEETAQLIFVTFRDWFDHAIDLFETRTGRIGRRHSIRGPAGTFIPRAAPMPTR
jgi:phage gpG-like protein